MSRQNQMRRVSGITIFLSMLASPCLQAQVNTLTPMDRARLDARGLLQDVTSSPFLDPHEIERLALALVDIRRDIPAVSGISDHVDESVLVFSLNEGVKHSLGTLAYDPDSYIRVRTIARVGIASVDRLNLEFGADSIQAVYFGSKVFKFRLYFPGVPNLRVLGDAYRRLPEVAYAGPELYLGGGGDWIKHFRKKGLWYFVFSHGYGDCPAGCINRDYYYVTYEPEEHTAELVDVKLSGTYSLAKVQLWDIPSRLSVEPYRDFGDLLQQAEDQRWWVRHHVVEALNYLIREAPTPLRGDASPGLIHFERIRQVVEDRRSDVLILLSERVADEDDSVRAEALRALVHVSGVDYGDGETGRERWRRWIESGSHQKSKK